MILPSNKKFGIFFSSVFFIFFLYSYYNNFNYFYIYLSLLLSFLFLLITAIKPNLLLPLNKAWMFFGFILGKITGPIILTIIYFFLITPFGFFRQLFGKDELMLKNKNLTSYWQKPEENDRKIDRFNNQF